MAIIRNVSRIYPVEQFVTALQRVSASVVHIQLPDSGSSGWFITPDIVLCPGFIFGGRFPVGLFDRVAFLGPEPLETKVSESPELLGQGMLSQGSADTAALAVLKVSQPMPERVLPLSFDAPAEGDQVTLIHFPFESTRSLGNPVSSVSFGQAQAVDGDLLAYDADTLPGSSGGPVLDRSWRVLAMHVASDGRRNLNQGLTRAAMLNLLRRSKWWPEIAAHHRIADDAAAQSALQSTPSADAEAAWPGPALIRAAISPRLDPGILSEDERAVVAELVVDSSATEWVMLPAERRRVIAGAGSLTALIQARGSQISSTTDAPLQQVIDDILSGAPYQLDNSSDDVLSSWIQASRWFEPVAGDLPKASDIAGMLARRRVRGQLTTLAGPEFQGRASELGKLRAWYNANEGPLVLTGIGGIGKSSLVARFASDLPPSTVLFWLDFDRADLAPDDAVSVLAAIGAQAAVQMDGFTRPDLNKDTWQDDANAMGRAIAALTRGQSAPLLVLDSFEAAQYAERYQELWPVIEAISRELPELRVCVTGRAQVPSLALNGRLAKSLHLIGLPKGDARRWLHAEGIDEPRTIEAVVKIARGIPLILKLAFRLVEAGGTITNVPKDLPKRLIAGYLYDRILHRVQNPKFRPVAPALLVLRRLTVEMIEPVLGGLVKLPKGDPASWFGELSREMGLVDGTTILLPRREVRSAALWLLERDGRTLVRSVDKRAAAWYRAQARDTPEDVAELVYHLLRIGDVEGAAGAWRDDCAAYLAFAAEDIRGRKAKAWLKDRLGDTSQAAQSLEAWESDALKRIRAARTRGLDRAVVEILRERAERTPDSPLVFHDAFELRAAGNPAGAIDVLTSAGKASGSAGRDRLALIALLKWERDDRRAADAALQEIQSPSVWGERAGRRSGVEALAVLAARMRLAIDIEKEAMFLTRSVDMDGVRDVLATVDVVSPRLRQKLRRTSMVLESSAEVFQLSPAETDNPRLLDAIERERRASLSNELAWMPSFRERLNQQSFDAVEAPVLDFAELNLPPASATALELAHMGWRRWWLAVTSSFLTRGWELSFSWAAFDLTLMSVMQDPTSTTPYSLDAAVSGSLALFAMRMETIRLDGLHMPLAEELRTLVLSENTIRIIPEHWQRLKRILLLCVDPDCDWDAFARLDSYDGRFTISGKDLVVHIESNPRLERDDVGTFLVFLLSPNPLLQLVYELAGAPPELQFSPRVL